MTEVPYEESTPLARRGGYARMAVLSSLAAMKHGRLTLTLPDGSTRAFGEGTNPRGARHGLRAAMSIRSDEFFRRCLFHSDIGFAESYMAGEWETGDLAEVISWFVLNAQEMPESSRARKVLLGWLAWADRIAHRLRSNTIDGSRENIAAHYDLSNDFFALFLDPSMTYSSALFERPGMTLEEAQTAKYERLCRVLGLRPGMKVLEIGGGWGAFARHAASKYGCHVTSVTVSQQQYLYAGRKLQEHGLGGQVDLRLADYRTLTGSYDRIVSIEMLEAVGHEYLDTWFGKCASLMKPDGLLAVQVITSPESRYDRMRKDVDFIQKHIFPGGQILSVGAMLDSVRRTGDLQMHDLHDMGDSYAETLRQWDERFQSRLQEVRALGFDETFVRKWHYYLMYCMAAFRMRHISAVQMVLTRPGNHSLGSREAR